MSGSLAETKSHNVPPDVFRKHYRDIRDATRACDEARMAVARLKKAAKADGIDLGALAIVEKMRKLDDDEAGMRIEKAFRYADWLGQPLGTQSALFPAQVERPTEKSDVEQTEWAAGEAGYLGGKGGKLRGENKFPEGSPLYTAWDKGWLRGIKILPAELKTKEQLKSDKKQDAKATISKISDMKGQTPPSADPKKNRRPRDTAANGSIPLH